MNSIVRWSLIGFSSPRIFLMSVDDNKTKVKLANGSNQVMHEVLLITSKEGSKYAFERFKLHKEMDP